MAGPQIPSKHEVTIPASEYMLPELVSGLSARICFKLHANLKLVLLEPPWFTGAGETLPLEVRTTSAPLSGRSSGL